MSAPKMYHRADKVNEKGNVSALCFKRPRGVDLKRALWTSSDESVTCPRCIRFMLADRIFRRLFEVEIKCGDGCWSAHCQPHPMVTRWHGSNEDTILAAIREELSR